MKWKTIFAVALVLLMVIPVVPAVTTRAAATGGVEVIPTAVSPGSPVPFFVNLTYLRNTLGWVGSQVSLYWSNNGYATIDPNNDVVAVSGVYVAGMDYVAGTLLAPSGANLSKLIGNNTSGYLFLKVTDGSNVAVSARFMIVANPEDYITVNTHKLAYTPGALGTTNVFEFDANLTGINAQLTAAEQINFNSSNTSTVKVIFTSTKNPSFNFTAFQVDVANNANTTTPTSDIFNITQFAATTNNTSGETQVFFNGILKDFPLNSTVGLYYTNELMGINQINYAEFTVTFQVVGNNSIPLNGTIKLIINNNVVNNPVTNYSLDDVKVSLKYPDEIEIYPSVEYTGFTDNTTLNTPTGEVNPNDRVTLELHNFPANSNITTITMYLYDANAHAYTSFLPFNINGAIQTDASGWANVTLLLPEHPYGGLSYVFVATVDDAGSDVIGLPSANVTVMPYIEAFAATDNGTFRATLAGPTAPGDYILVKGHGFLKEQVTLTANLATNLTQVLFNLQVLASYGTSNPEINVLSNGTFLAIAKIPADVWTNNTFKIVANGATPSDEGTHLGTFEFVLGDNADGVQKVYVNPTPVIVNANNGYIELGLSPAYPYPAVWEMEEYRVFTVEVIGLDPTNFSTVSINLTDGTHTVEIESNVTPVYGYLLFTNVHVPETPMGDYNVVVYNVTDPSITETTPFPEVNVTHTTALQDPLSGMWVKTVFIPGPMDVNISGYGWPDNVPMEWDINELAILGYVNLTIQTLDLSGQVYTDANGSFIGVLRTSIYLYNQPNGIYHITVHPENSNLSDIVAINLGQPPALLVKVDTGKTKLVGDTLDVWVLVRFSNGALANDSQVPDVRVFVFMYTSSGTTVSLNGPTGEQAEYTGIPGLWHYTFQLNDTVKGKDLAVFVNATGHFASFLPLTTANDLAVVTVSGVLDDKLNNISNGIAQINETVNEIYMKVEEISNKIAQLNDTITELKTTLVEVNATLSGQLAELEQMITEISANLTSMLDQVNETLTYIITAMMENMENLTSQLDELSMTLEAINSNLTSMLVDLENYITAMNSNITGSLNDINASLGNVQSDLQDISANIQHLQSALASLRDSISSKLDSINATIVNTGNDLSGKLDNLSNKVDKVDSDVGAVSTKVDAVQTTLGQINKKLDDIQNSIDTVHNNMTKAKGDILNAINDLGSNTRSDINQVGDSVKNFGIASVVLLIIVLIIAAYGAFSRKG